MTDIRRSPRRYLVWAGISLLLTMMAVVTVVSTLLATESGSRMVTQWGLTRLAAMEDIEVSVQDIRGNLLQGLRLGEVNLVLPAVTVQAGSLLADWDPFSLLTGNFQLSRLHLDAITVQLADTGDAASQSSDSPLQDLQFAALPVDIAIADFAISDLRINSGQQQIEIAELNTAIALRDIVLDISGLSMDSNLIGLSGDLELELSPGLPIDANLRWTYPRPMPMELGRAAGALLVTGSVDHLQVKHQLDSPFVLLSNGVIEPFTAQGPRVELRHQAERLLLPGQLQSIMLDNLELTMRGVPSALELSLLTGARWQDVPQLEIAMDGRLAGQALTLSAELGSPGGALQTTARVDFAAALDIAGDFTLAESDPMALIPGQEQFPLQDLSANGTFQFRQASDELELRVALDQASALLDGYAIAATGSVERNNSSWLFDNLMLTSNTNLLRVNGRVDEAIDLVWELEAPALQEFVPGVQARAVGEGSLQGTIEAPSLAATVSIDTLSAEFGTLNSLRLTLQGDAEFLQGELQLGEAEIGNQQSSLSLDQATLEFAGNAAEHTVTLMLGADYGGSALSADLALSGGFSDVIGGDWQGQLLRGGLGGAAGNWQLQSPSQLAFTDQQFSMLDSCWRYAQIQLCADIEPGADGAYRAEASVQGFPLQELNAPAEGEALFALAGLPRLPAGVALEGEANAALRAEFGGTQVPAFNLTSTTDDAVLILQSRPEDEYGAQRSDEEILEQRYTWRQLNVRSDYHEGDWQFDARAQLDTENLQDSQLPLTGEMNAQLTLDSEGNLRGTSDAEFSDLGWVSAFLPELRNVSGRLASQLNIAGTVDDPQLTGAVHINDAAFFLERTGVAYSDFDMSLNGSSFSSATLQGSLTSDSGNLSYSGAVQGLNSVDWQVVAELKGDSFQVASTENLTLQISPELNLNANAQRINLSGNLHVPVLDLVLQELPESAVDISRDVVIESYPEDRPDLARSYTSNQTAMFDLPMTADLNLSLGDQVTFTGFGLQAGLQGELEVQQQITGASFTYGELAIREGYYRIYGQQLNLQDGKLLFLGNYANPALDIRAVRAVQDQTVGVQINGTLNNMHSQLFSSPALPESDILAVLVTGRPASQLQSTDGDAMLGAIASLGIERGQSLTDDLGNRLGLDTVAITNTGNIDSSELTIGKYLTPQVFIRYGVGLFDRFSKVAVDYMINDRLTLQAESGEYQSIDFTYRVER